MACHAVKTSATAYAHSSKILNVVVLLSMCVALIVASSWIMTAMHEDRVSEWFATTVMDCALALV